MDHKDNYFNDTMLMKISAGVVDILENDAEFFYFIKNNKTNINGFLNILLPILSDNRNELHTTFLKKNNNNEELCKIVENNLYGVYLHIFTTTEDSYTTLSLRFTKANYNKFRIMHDTMPQKYDMDFTNYLRSLLSEYAIKRFPQREIIFKQNIVTQIEKAIDECKLCTIYAEHLANEPDNRKNFYFAPFTLALHPYTDEILVAGKNENNNYIIPLVCITDIIVSDKSLQFNEADYDEIRACIYNFFDNLDEDEADKEDE